MNRLRLVSTCVLPALLAACGGGGDSPAASGDIAKYAGNWGTCIAFNDMMSLKIDTSVTPTSGNSARLVEHNANYDQSTDCSGPMRESRRFESTITQVGQAQVGGETGDRIDMEFISPRSSDRSNTSKRIMLIRPDGKLYGGAVSDELPAGRDAQGYPSGIGTKYVQSRL